MQPAANPLPAVTSPPAGPPAVLPTRNNPPVSTPVHPTPPTTPTTTTPPTTPPQDPDLLDQARPGHGVPSQDPDPTAQVPLLPDEAVQEAGTVLMGGGLVAGAVTGAVVGVAVGGPVGVVIGTTLGAVAGALGGAAAGVAAHALADSVRLHTEDSGGSGRPVVLIHGWPLSSASWAPQVSALQAAGHRVVAYDRRGFGRSDKPDSGHDYDTLADDLHRVMDTLGLQDVTLVGFSMGGGEVARYIARFGESRLHSVVFAASVTPCLMRSADNPDGPLTPDAARDKREALVQDRAAFFDTFTRNFFSAHGALMVTELQRAEAIALCLQSQPYAALACMDAFSTSDFRDDLKRVMVPTLILHGEADAIVPLEGSGSRTHSAIAHSVMVQVPGAPHGLNLSHASAFNEALLSFLRRSPVRVAA